MKRHIDYVIPVTSEEQFIKVKKEIKRECKIFFKCCDCNKPTVLLLRKINNWPGKCKQCKTEDTNIIKYGTKYQTQCDNFKIKKLKTQNGIWLTEKAKTKMRATKKEKYGDEYYTNRELSSKTYNFHKTTDKNFTNNIKEKMIKTCNEKYNTDWYRQTEEYNDKIKATNNKKYGSDYFFTSKTGKQKIEESMLKNWGVRSPMQNPIIRNKTKRKYTYNNINFDSSWEIAFYIWLKDHNIRFEYHSCNLQYEFKNKIHYYEVDFKLWNNTLIEIKGNHLLKSMEKNTETLENAKYKCMLEHNVKIITDCSEYLQYIKNKYGTNYLRKFKNNK